MKRTNLCAYLPLSSLEQKCQFQNWVNILYFNVPRSSLLLPNKVFRGSYGSDSGPGNSSEASDYILRHVAMFVLAEHF